jgi:hypothetical protein
MEVRKALLCAASVLAFTAAQTPADAAVSPASTASAKSITPGAYADPLLEVLDRTGGGLAANAVESALREIFSRPTPAQISAMPNLLTGLISMGAPAETIAKSRALLDDIVSAAQDIGEQARAELLAGLEQRTIIQLAAKRQCPPGMTLTKTGPNRFHCEPDEVGQVPREPNEIGQVPGGGGAS